MTLEDAKKEAQKGNKMTHIYFTDSEYIIMKGNMIVFEDGVSIFFNDWVQNKEYLNNGWSFYNSK